MAMMDPNQDATVENAPLPEIERLRGLLRDVARSPVITEARGYVEVQLDRPTWAELAEWR